MYNYLVLTFDINLPAAYIPHTLSHTTSYGQHG